MQRTNIEWVKNPDGSRGFSWNPIRGRCPVRCSLPNGEIYCYGHKHYDLRPWLEEGTGQYGALIESEIWAPKWRKKPSRIFLCSLFEFFYHKNRAFRDIIIQTIRECPQHTFIILTKMPEQIDFIMPDNVWLGCSITGESGSMERSIEFGKAEARIKFISYEPMLGGYKFNTAAIDWLIIGRLQHFGNKYDPERRYIDDEVRGAQRKGIKIFLKKNLKKIWGENLIQEWPE